VNARDDGMTIETQLPLGHLDPGLRTAAGALDLARVGEEARLAEALGYDGIVTEETKDDPFVVLALAAQATERVGLPTGAFPRAPAGTALAAWPLQRLSKGRLPLGLGSQAMPYRAPLWHGLDATRAVDARLCRRAARDLGVLAERRHQAQLRERTLQAQADGAAVRAAADR